MLLCRFRRVRYTYIIIAVMWDIANCNIFGFLIWVITLSKAYLYYNITKSRRVKNWQRYHITWGSQGWSEKADRIYMIVYTRREMSWNNAWYSLLWEKRAKKIKTSIWKTCTVPVVNVCWCQEDTTAPKSDTNCYTWFLHSLKNSPTNGLRLLLRPPPNDFLVYLCFKL